MSMFRETPNAAVAQSDTKTRGAMPHPALAD
jgi:hypothetical protein